MEECHNDVEFEREDVFVVVRQSGSCSSKFEICYRGLYSLDGRLEIARLG